MSAEKDWQVYVNVRGVYNVTAKTEKEAHKEALAMARDNTLPDEVEYAGDGVEYAVMTSESSDDDE